jgi:hypothetical protein
MLHEAALADDATGCRGIGDGISRPTTRGLNKPRSGESDDEHRARSSWTRAFHARPEVPAVVGCILSNLRSVLPPRSGVAVTGTAPVLGGVPLIEFRIGL